MMQDGKLVRIFSTREEILNLAHGGRDQA